MSVLALIAVGAISMAIGLVLGSWNAARIEHEREHERAELHRRYGGTRS